MPQGNIRAAINASRTRSGPSRLAAMLLFVAVPIGLAACGSSTTGTSATSTQATATIGFNGTVDGGTGPFAYGIEHGLYTKEGVHLVPRTVSGGSALAQYLSSGKLDFGANVTAADVLKYDSKGFHLVSIFGTVQVGPAAVIVPAASSIKSIKDLAGKSVAVGIGTTTSSLLPALLKANGLSASQVQIEDVATSALPTLLTAGKVDSVLGFFNGLAVSLDGKGFPVRSLLFSNFGVPLNGGGLVTTEQEIKQHPAVVREVVAATQKAFIASEKDNAAEVAAIQKLDGVTAPSASTIEQQIKVSQTAFETKADKGHPLGYQATADWLATERTASEYLGLTNAPKVTAAMTNKFLP